MTALVIDNSLQITAEIEDSTNTERMYLVPGFIKSTPLRSVAYGLTLDPEDVSLISIGAA